MAGQQLTVTQIERYKPVKPQKVLIDGNGLQLRLRLLRDGTYSRTWLYAYKAALRSAYLTLGEYRARLTDFDVSVYRLDPGACLTLEVARRIAAELSDRRRKDVDPKQWLKAEADRLAAEQRTREREQERARLEAEQYANRKTVSALFDHWAKIELSSRRDGGKETVRGFHKDILPVIGHLPAEDVTKADVMQIIDTVLARNAPRMAKRFLSEMRQMFGFALDREIIHTDPTARIKKDRVGGKDVIRTRHLSEDEIVLLAKQLPAAHFTLSTATSIWIMLSTLCRVGELSRARWRDVDFSAGTWTIPEEHAKNEKKHVIYLSAFATEQFRLLQEHRTHDIWVFPDRSGTTHVNVKSISKQVGDRQRATPLRNRSMSTSTLVLPGGHWTPHDLRRTGATMMGNLGMSADVIERCLNHTEQDRLKRTYHQHQMLDEQKAAWHRLGERLSLLLSPANNVVILQLKG